MVVSNEEILKILECVYERNLFQELINQMLIQLDKKPSIDIITYKTYSERINKYHRYVNRYDSKLKYYEPLFRMLNTIMDDNIINMYSNYEISIDEINKLKIFTKKKVNLIETKKTV